MKRNIRIGLGKGKGMGYKDILPGHDKRVHTESGHGMKQPQMLNPVAFRALPPNIPPEERKYYPGLYKNGKYVGLPIPRAKVTSVEIMRAEGSYDDDPNLGKKQTFKTLEEADARLMEISKTAPKTGGYDKTDVTVHFDNGDNYTGRWDVKHFSQPNADLSITEHIRDFLEFHAGENERGKKFIEEGSISKETVEEAKADLKTWDLGEKKKRPESIKAEIPNFEPEKLRKEDLGRFTGSEEIHRWSPLYPRYRLTDGAKYVAEKGEAYWLMDLIGSWQSQAKVRNEEFQVWQLKKEGKGWVATAEDGNGHRIAKQEIPYSDFPLDDIKLFFTNNTIMLPREY